MISNIEKQCMTCLEIEYMEYSFFIHDHQY